MTLFATILQSLGLSQAEAAAYLNVRPDTVKSWSAGRNPVRSGVYSELRALAVKQRTAAVEAFKAWREAKKPGEIEFALPDDAEINRRGWPSRGAFLTIAAHLWAMLPDDVSVTIVPSASTESVLGAERNRRWAE